MRLRELRGTFVKEIFPATGKVIMDQSAEDAQGLMLDCPSCRKHVVILWFGAGLRLTTRPVDKATFPLKRFQANGDSIDNLTLVEDFGVHDGRRYYVGSGYIHELKSVRGAGPLLE